MSNITVDARPPSLGSSDPAVCLWLLPHLNEGAGRAGQRRWVVHVPAFARCRASAGRLRVSHAPQIGRSFPARVHGVGATHQAVRTARGLSSKPCAGSACRGCPFDASRLTPGPSGCCPRRQCRPCSLRLATDMRVRGSLTARPRPSRDWLARQAWGVTVLSEDKLRRQAGRQGPVQEQPRRPTP
jgi:hypothetical protein